MTEEEAKTKWCAMAHDAEGGNRYHENKLFPTNCCIASDCMMWRLDEERDENMVLVPCDTGGHCGLINN